MKERWVADFSKSERSCFDIKPENSYNAKLEKGSLFLGLKKKHCLAWLETANRVYVDQVIDARFRFGSPEGYCASGIMFRVMEKGTYYLALVSSKGYFRLDSVHNRVPKPLIGWTEAPVANLTEAKPDTIALGVVAWGDHLIFTLNGKWIAETKDASIPGGHLGFALVSYGSEADACLDATQTVPTLGGAGIPADSGEPIDDYVCRAWLDHLSVDSSPNAVAREYGKWTGGTEVCAESRLCLAETFVALNQFDAAYDQILQAWKQRENAARSVTATYTDTRTGRELLFAARLATQLGKYEAAQEYIGICLSADANVPIDGAGEMELLAEKAKVLNALNRFEELAAFLPEYILKLETESLANPESTGTPPVPPMYALLGHAHQNLKNYKAAVAAWNKAFTLSPDNGLYAQNVAAAYEGLGKKKDALHYLLAAGNCFLQKTDFEKLETLLPKLLTLGKNNREAHLLAANWAKAAGDSTRADLEFAKAERLLPTPPGGDTPDENVLGKATGVKKTARGETGLPDTLDEAFAEETPRGKTGARTNARRTAPAVTRETENTVVKTGTRKPVSTVTGEAENAVGKTGAKSGARKPASKVAGETENAVGKTKAKSAKAEKAPSAPPESKTVKPRAKTKTTATKPSVKPIAKLVKTKKAAGTTPEKKATKTGSKATALKSGVKPKAGTKAKTGTAAKQTGPAKTPASTAKGKTAAKPATKAKKTPT